MIYPFYFFAVLQLIFSWRSLAGGFSYLHYFRSELASVPAGSFPFASVIVPCKGLDQGLEENLRAIVEQDYPGFEVVFVFEDADDPAAEIVARLKGSANTDLRTVIAGRALDCGQKVHNLIAATDSVADRTGVLVFADSDARPSTGWLKSLVSAAPETRGCSSGYRWFLPEKGGIATELRSVWNASIASALGSNERTNFSWGGSTAIRKEIFDGLGVREAWKGTVSDDFALTRAIKSSGGGVKFVPACLTATVEDCTFREMMEFTTRQMKITRVYSSGLWLLSFVSAGLWLTSLFFAVVVEFGGGLHAWFAGVFIALVLAAGTAKAWLRLKAVSLALADHREALRRQAFWQITLWVASPLIFLFNDIAALVSRRIVWRDIEYELESPQRTRVVRKDG
jgi:cellulose synthase/poly-beta-1,6-N-acetylglucosamine synthase-like glycosyltransferase